MPQPDLSDLSLLALLDSMLQRTLAGGMLWERTSDSTPVRTLYLAEIGDYWVRLTSLGPGALSSLEAYTGMVPVLEIGTAAGQAYAHCFGPDRCQTLDCSAPVTFHERVALRETNPGLSEDATVERQMALLLDAAARQGRDSAMDSSHHYRDRSRHPGRMPAVRAQAATLLRAMQKPERNTKP